MERRALSERSETQTALLPEAVQAMLRLGSPVELLCVEAHVPLSANTTGATKLALSTLLCVYSRKNAYYLDVLEEGEISVEATEAFRQYFCQAHEDVTIVRIRSAPQRRLGFASLCPRGAMAMLTLSPRCNEYSLLLQHSKEDDLVTIPVTAGFEDLDDRESQSISDFCFAQSESLSLLSTMTILLLQQSGDVLSAGPVLFEGSVVQKSAWDECMAYLNYARQLVDPTSARGRQCAAAQKYIQTGFVEQGTTGSTRSSYMTCKVVSQTHLDSPMSWPAKVVGPVLSSTESPGRSLVIENFPASDLVGVAIGGEHFAIDLGLISPSCFLPRFALEYPADTLALNENLDGRSGIVVLRLVVSEDDGEGTESSLLTNQSLALVRDPQVNTILHYVIPKAVITVTTTAMRQESRHIAGYTTPSCSPNTTSRFNRNEMTVHTSARTSINVSSSGSFLQGAIVCTDPCYGHALFVCNSDGTWMPVNVTESRYLHELEHLVNPDGGSGSTKLNQTAMASTASSLESQRLDFLNPLYELVEPLLKDISRGLSGFGKIIGTQTPSKNITPVMMAVALSVKKRCDKEVVLRLIELKKTITARRDMLRMVLEEQKKQVEHVKETIESLRVRTCVAGSTIERARRSATDLAKRSDAVLQASRDLLPSLTKAEIAFFQQLKRLDAKLHLDEKQFVKTSATMKSLRPNLYKGKFKCAIDLGDQVPHCDQLLDGQAKIMDICRAELEQSGRIASDIAWEIGVSGADSREAQ